MRNNREEFNYLIDQMLENAVKEFKDTEEYSLLEEKLEQMEWDCENMLRPEEKEFAEECFEIIMDVDGREEAYVYRKGFKDCISILRLMGVLA